MRDSCIIYIVRHGQTKWNVDRRIQGQKDLPLTAIGRQQAKNLSKKLYKIRFDAVFSSDLIRAYDTAYQVALQNKLVVVTSVLLREKKYGHLEGKRVGDLKEFDEILKKLSHEQRSIYKMDKQAESDFEVNQRFARFIKEIAARYTGKSVLVVTHAAVIRSFLVHLGLVTYQNLPEGSIENASYIQLETDGADIRIMKTEGIMIKNEV